MDQRRLTGNHMKSLIPPNRPLQSNPRGPYYLKIWSSDVGPGQDVLGCVWRYEDEWTYRFRYRSLVYPAHEIRCNVLCKFSTESALLQGIEEQISNCGPHSSWVINGDSEALLQRLANDRGKVRRRKKRALAKTNPPARPAQRCNRAGEFHEWLALWQKAMCDPESWSDAHALIQEEL